MGRTRGHSGQSNQGQEHSDVIEVNLVNGQNQEQVVIRVNLIKGRNIEDVI